MIYGGEKSKLAHRQLSRWNNPAEKRESPWIKKHFSIDLFSFARRCLHWNLLTHMASATVCFRSSRARYAESQQQKEREKCARCFRLRGGFNVHSWAGEISFRHNSIWFSIVIASVVHTSVSSAVNFSNDIEFNTFITTQALELFRWSKTNLQGELHHVMFGRLDKSRLLLAFIIITDNERFSLSISTFCCLFSAPLKVFKLFNCLMFWMNKISKSNV